MPRRRLLTEQQVRFTAEGQTVVGTYIGMDNVPYRDGKILNKYTFENEIGTMVLMGSTKIDEAMGRCAVGDVVEITYKGTVPTSAGFTMKLYDIAVLEEDEDGEEPKGPRDSGPKGK